MYNKHTNKKMYKITKFKWFFYYKKLLRYLKIKIYIILKTRKEHSTILYTFCM